MQYEWNNSGFNVLFFIGKYNVITNYGTNDCVNTAAKKSTRHAPAAIWRQWEKCAVIQVCYVIKSELAACGR